MEAIIQEKENSSLKFEVILFQGVFKLINLQHVTVTCFKFISLKIASTCVAETSHYKIYIVQYFFAEFGV